MTIKTLRQLLITSLNKRKSVIEIGIAIFYLSHYCISLKQTPFIHNDPIPLEQNCINDLKLHE